MLMEWKRERPEGCISDLEFDEWRALELDAGAALALTEHVAGCQRCQQRRALLEAQAAEFLQRFPELDLPALTTTKSSVRAKSSTEIAHESSHRARARGSIVSWRRGWAIASGLAGLAAAALALLLLRPVEPASDGELGTRIKGSSRLGFFVKRGNQVLPGGDEEVVHPHDLLRFTLTTVRPSHTAILSLDGAGVASVYHPAGAQSQRFGVVRDEALDQSIDLDATLGRERIWAVFCEAPFEVEPLRAQLEADRELKVPAGCTVDQLTLVKQAGP